MIKTVQIISKGPTGPQGTKGETGDQGAGVPLGGTTGQVLKKLSDANNDTEWADEAGGTGSTNLSIGTVTTTTVDINSDTGTDATIPAVVADVSAGLMTAADKSKLDSIAASANNYAHPDHTGDVTSTGDGATVIASNVVDNAKLSDIAQNTIKGRVSAGSGDPEDLTATQVRTLLNVEDGAAADQSASEVPYNNATSGLSAIDVQSAIDEVDSRVDTLESAGTGTSWTITTAQTGELSSGDIWLADPTAATVTRSLPLTPTDGDEAWIKDDKGVASDTNKVVIGANGKNIMGLAQDLEITFPYGWVRLKYITSITSWQIISST